LRLRWLVLRGGYAAFVLTQPRKGRKLIARGGNPWARGASLIAHHFAPAKSPTGAIVIGADSRQARRLYQGD